MEMSAEKRVVSLLVLILLCLLCQATAIFPGSAFSSSSSGRASSVAVLTELQEFQLHPNLYLWGFGGDRTLAEGQGLLPLVWDQGRVFYGIAEGKVANGDNNSWLGALGIGYRKIIGSRIYGAYALASYNNVSSDINYTSLSAGAESLGNIWDFRVNGYFPFAIKKENIIREGWASDFGIGEFTKFTQHNEFDVRAKQITVEDIDTLWGMDAEVGSSLPRINNLKWYVGGYFYDRHDLPNINGVAARMRYDLTQYVSLELKDSYDNKRQNMALLGMRFAFGGFSDKEKMRYGLATKLLEPIEHNFATITNGYGVPVEGTTTTKIDLNTTKLEKKHDNIQFIVPASDEANTAKNDSASAVIGDGTFENPYVGFTDEVFQRILPQANSGVIDKFPLLYFASGAYSLDTFTSRALSGRFALPNGWSMNGRMFDADQPQLGLFGASAIGEQRPQFTGGVDLNYAPAAGGAETKIISIKIIDSEGSQDPTTSGGGENAVLYVNNAANVALQNVDLESHVTDPNTFALGMYINNSIVNIVNGKNDFIGDGAQKGHGIFVTAENGTSQLNILNGQNSISSSGDGSVPGFNIGLFMAPKQSGNVFVDFKNGDNNVISDAGIGIWIRPATAISAATANLNFSGGSNSIVSKDDGINVSLESPVTANVNFVGGVNSVEPITGQGIEISALSGSTVNLEFAGGNNEIEATQDAIRLGNTGATINLDFIDGENTISNTNGTESRAIYSIIINPSGRTNINFRGGDNTISANSSSISGKAYGIFIDDSTGIFNTLTSINFLTPPDAIKVRIIANANERYGIFVDNPGTNPVNILDRNGAPVTATSIKDYVDFESEFGTLGDAMVWTFTLPWESAPAFKGDAI